MGDDLKEANREHRRERHDEILDIATRPFDDAGDLAPRFREMIDILPETDGVRRFCQVHEVMSVQVDKNLREGTFKDREGLELMDVLLVQRFFDQVAQWERRGETVSKAWEPLFDRRDDGKYPILYAIAGIHAHVASDLLWAVLQTHDRLGRKDPELGSPLHDDYCAVNGIELELRDIVEKELGGEEWDEWDERLGAADDYLRSFSFARARDKCWLDACANSRMFGPLAAVHREAVDRTTGFANRLLLL